MPRKDAPVPGSISAQAQQDLVSEGIENFELPKSIVTKIAKSAIPENVKLQKETILSLVKGSTVFINYLAATAHDVAVSKQHKSISASDVLRALEVIELGDLAEKLQNELNVYRELAKTDKKKAPTTPASAPVAGAGKPKSNPQSGVSISIPPASKAKGKGKAEPSAFATQPLHGAAVQHNESISTGPSHSMAMEVDEEPNPPQEREPDIPSEHGERDEENEAQDEMNEYEDDNGPQEELVDTIALENEELRRDANALDEGPQHDHEMD